MTVREFSDLCNIKIKVMSSYNGKILCKAFNPEKHTEIGDIPADWEIQTFEETFRILSNNTLSRENFNNRGGAVRNIHYGDILTRFPEVLDCCEEDIPYINDLGLITSSAQLLQDGDIITAVNGKPVKNLAEFYSELANATKSINFDVYSNGGTITTGSFKLQFFVLHQAK